MHIEQLKNVNCPCMRSYCDLSYTACTCSTRDCISRRACVLNYVEDNTRPVIIIRASNLIYVTVPSDMTHAKHAQRSSVVTAHNLQVLRQRAPPSLMIPRRHGACQPPPHGLTSRTSATTSAGSLPNAWTQLLSVCQPLRASSRLSAALSARKKPRLG